MMFTGLIFAYASKSAHGKAPHPHLVAAQQI
jgi:hypothetical protein